MEGVRVARALSHGEGSAGGRADVFERGGEVGDVPGRGDEQVDERRAGQVDQRSAGARGPAYEEDLRGDDQQRAGDEEREGDLGQRPQAHRKRHRECRPAALEAVALQQQQQRDRGQRHQEEVLERVVEEADQQRHRRHQGDRQQACDPAAEEGPGDLPGGEVEDRRDQQVEQQAAARGRAEEVDERQQQDREQGPARGVGGVDRPQQVDRAAALQDALVLDRDREVVRLVPGGDRGIEEDPDAVGERRGDRQGYRRLPAGGVEPALPGGHGRKIAALSLAVLCRW